MLLNVYIAWTHQTKTRVENEITGGLSFRDYIAHPSLWASELELISQNLKKKKKNIHLFLELLEQFDLVKF